MYADRLRGAARRLADAGGGALLVAPSPDLRYLVGYEPMPLERPTLLVITADAPVLLVPRLERPLAAAAPAAGDLELLDWRDDEDPYAIVASCIVGAGTVFVGDRIWGSHVLALQRAVPGAAWASAAPIVGAMRARKDDVELAALRRAAAAADAALANLLSGPLTGRSEQRDRAGVGRAVGRPRPRPGRVHDRRLGTQLRVAASRGRGAHDPRRRRGRARLRWDGRRLLQRHDTNGGRRRTRGPPL